MTRRCRSVLFVTVLTPVLCFAQSKVGYVDSNALLTRYTAAVDARQKLEDQNGQWGQEMARMNDDLRRLEEELDKQSLLLSEAKKTEKVREIEAKREEIRTFQDQKWGQNGEYFKKQSELMQPILERINEIIHRMGEDEKYDYILDTAQGSVLYAQEGHDLTDRILADLERSGGTTTETQRR